MLSQGKSVTAAVRTLTVLLVMVCSVAIADKNGLEEYGNRVDGVRHVNAAEAAAILQKYPAVKVLDVRTGFEYQRGHLPDATNINYYSFTFKDQLDKLDKNVTWLVHCRTGVRSGKTLPIMKSLGFESIVHLDGGIVTWTDDGLPLVR